MGVEIGMPVEVAVWLTGRETEYQMECFRKDCAAELGAFGLEHGVLMGEPRLIEKLPGEDRVPPVPANVSGPNVRLLIFEAEVKEFLRPQIIKSSGFVHDLDKQDLARLRTITRVAHQKNCPLERPLTDAECDDVIEQIGPTIALKTLRGVVDSKAIN
jgi:hypothetical protein